MPEWEDDFDGPPGTPPSPRWWSAELGGGGWGDGQLQWYTDDPANAALDGQGRLAIVARREPAGRITSARLITKDRVTAHHGRVEARIRPPAGRGTWSAFWLLGADIDAVGWPRCGEIDVMEVVGTNPAVVHATVHGPGHAGLGRGIGTVHDTGADLTAGFHDYGVDWTADRVTWTLDGAPYATLARTDLPAGAWALDHDFYVLLNLAIGGDWPGNAADGLELPVTMLVDWVRIEGVSQVSGRAHPVRRRARPRRAR